MKKFTLYWLRGDKTLVEGKTISEAFSKAGYGNGAIPALDFYSEGHIDEYKYINHRWTKNETS